MTDSAWRDTLRALPVFSGDLPGFNTDAAPESPIPLVEEWLSYAIDSEISQPHVMTLATAGADGSPSARNLLLKDALDKIVSIAALVRRWHYAGHIPHHHLMMTVGEHLRVLDSMLDGDVEGAIAALDEHLSLARARTLERLEDATPAS